MGLRHAWVVVAATIQPERAVVLYNCVCVCAWVWDGKARDILRSRGWPRRRAVGVLLNFGRVGFVVRRGKQCSRPQQVISPRAVIQRLEAGAAVITRHTPLVT